MTISLARHGKCACGCDKLGYDVGGPAIKLGRYRLGPATGCPMSVDHSARPATGSQCVRNGTEGWMLTDILSGAASVFARTGSSCGFDKHTRLQLVVSVDKGREWKANPARPSGLRATQHSGYEADTGVL